jgi:TM2 domain-containing membrane protein YozV
LSNFCVKCGKENPDESKFCAGCGSAVNDTNDATTTQTNNNPSPNYNHNPNQRPAQWKSEGTTLILTIVLGLFGLGGIGHIYLGNITRGIVILIVGIILLVVAAVTMGIGLIILIPFAIWVVFDSRKQCKHYNDHLEQTGKPPW